MLGIEVRDLSMCIRSFFTMSLIFAVIPLVLAGCISGGMRGGAAISVAPDMAEACVIASANKYYLPTRVIKAVSAQKAAGGATKVIMKVDLRDAVCTIDASGAVHSVVDTTGKSADQMKAEQMAAQKPVL